MTFSLSSANSLDIGCGGGATLQRLLKQGGKFAILVEVIDGDSMWTNVVEGMIAYSPEELKTLLDDAGFIHTEIYRMKPFISGGAMQRQSLLLVSLLSAQTTNWHFGRVSSCAEVRGRTLSRDRLSSLPDSL